MGRESISDVVVMHAQAPLRTLLRLMLAQQGYIIFEAKTYDAVLRHLRGTAEPIVVVAGNSTPDYRAEVAFFGHITADAALARRHRFVLLCTLPDRLPSDFQATVNSLGVLILPMPSRMFDLVEAVALAAGRTQVAGETAG
jgi:hypothetical protein